MSGGDKPTLTARAEAELAARREREAAALRANLRRRKDQQRAKRGPTDAARIDPPEPASPDCAANQLD